MIITSRPELRTLSLDDAAAPSPTAEKVKQALRRLPAPYMTALREQGAVGRITVDETHVTFNVAEGNQVVFCAIDNAAMVTLERAASMLRGVAKRATVNEVASDTPMGTLAGQPVFKDRLHGGRGLAGAMLQQKLHTLWDEVGTGLVALRSAAVAKQQESAAASSPEDKARLEREAAVASAASSGVQRLVEIVGKQILAASAPAPVDPLALPGSRH